jgi:hypothetical protein
MTSITKGVRIASLHVASVIIYGGPVVTVDRIEVVIGALGESLQWSA